MQHQQQLRMDNSSLLRLARKTPIQDERYNAAGLRRENIILRQTSRHLYSSIVKNAQEGRCRIDTLTRLSKCTIVTIYVLCAVIVALVYFR